jgi:DNA polymerase
VHPPGASDPAAWREAARAGSAALADLARAARSCRACPLWERATQVVFGEGPARAGLVLVGEQPGDQEDLAGRPFVGPAGKLLDRALAEAGIDRRRVYVTNAVKHFKFAAHGKRRLHEKPGAREVRACLPWLEAELAALTPDAVVCLGATAARALLGSDFRVTERRGEVLVTAFAARVMATVHPSSLLRLPDAETRRSELARFVADLSRVARFARKAASARHAAGVRASAR